MRQLKIKPTITSRSESSIDKYLNEINRIPMITPEKEVELAKRIQAGDQDALTQLVNANLRFVVSVAKQYHNDRFLGLSDLISEGNQGLIEAAKRFDHTKGFKFISYAVRRIRESILKAFADKSRLIRLPYNKVNNIVSINKFIAGFEHKNERGPTDEELGNMGMDPIHKTTISSLDECLSDESDRTLHDIFSDGISSTECEINHNGFKTITKEILQLICDDELYDIMKKNDNELGTYTFSKNRSIEKSYLQRAIIEYKYGFRDKELYYEATNQFISKKLNISLPLVDKLLREAFTKIKKNYRKGKNNIEIKAVLE
ncbi:MAG TPA: sigma-70 family RNA polymerase sigma factor [Candidatus Absconditabacterales bacterium]|nr:sigma-70 family RNA polymerase sigma factor [Candidatus Absconditabacterales bacterium]HNG97594.1 sigma-70 family RNA polymerase sigma factor [Candidatus Absconditabacterales bacterium]